MSLYEQFQDEQVATPTGGLYAQFLKDREKINQPSLLSRTITGVKDYAQKSAETIPTFLGALRSPWQTLQKAPSIFTESLMAGEKKAGEGLYDIVKTPGVANKVAGTAKLISGLAEAAFSPITGLFHLAENTPGLKQVADTINIPFTAAGFAGAWSSGKAIDWIPEKVVSKESKDIFKQSVQEVGSLAAQILIGGKLMREIEKRTSKGKVVTPEEAKKIIVKAQEEAHQVMINTPGTRYAAYRQSQGYEPYLAEGELPVIQMGAKSKETLPVINIGEKSSKVKSELRYEPIIQPKSIFEQFKAEVKKTPTSELRVNPVVESKIEITGEEAVNTRAKKLLESAVEKKLIEAVDTGEIPTHSRMNMAEQAKLATDLIETNRQQALDIALGKEPSSGGVLPESVYTALEIRAIKEGDVELMRQLKNSQLPTLAGQALKALDSADPYSPVKIMRDIQKAREVAVEKKTNKKVVEQKAQVVKEIKDKIPKVKKQTWEEFLEEIKCNY